VILELCVETVLDSSKLVDNNVWDENKDKKQYCSVFEMATKGLVGSQHLKIYERVIRKWSGSLRNLLRAMAASCCAVECMRWPRWNPARDFIFARP
jgi:hypothetical protein